MPAVSAVEIPRAEPSDREAESAEQQSGDGTPQVNQVSFDIAHSSLLRNRSTKCAPRCRIKATGIHIQRTASSETTPGMMKAAPRIASDRIQGCGNELDAFV